MAASVYLMEPPPGAVRSLAEPPNNGLSVVPAGLATTLVAVVCVCLRVFTRVHVVSGDLGWDDYLVLCALVFSMAFFFVGRHLYQVGAGRHMWDVLFSEYSPGFLQTTTAATLTYAISITFSKLSILTFYLRISPDHKFRIAVFTLVGVVVAYTVAYIFVMVFRCSPVAAGWDLLVKGRCIDNLIPMMVLSIANILIDLVILCLPLKVVVPLQIPTRQKLSLVLLFATGGFVCAAAIKRTIIMPPLLASTDYTWNLTEQFIWSFIEVNAGILCASLAALKPLFMRYIPVLIVSRLRSSAVKDSAAVSAPKPDSKSSTVYGYELHSRDDLPAAKQPQRDDEAQLWARGQQAPDADSMDGSEELYPGVKPPRLTVSHGAYGMQSGADGVKVIKETHVSYPN